MSNVIALHPVRIVANNAPTIIRRHDNKTPESKARVGLMAQDCVVAINHAAEEAASREERIRLRVEIMAQMRAPIEKALALYGALDVELMLSLALADVKKMQRWVKLKEDSGTELKE